MKRRVGQASRLPGEVGQASRLPGLTLAEIADAVVSCEKCTRLRRYCEMVAREKKRAYRDETYWGRPVPGFGDPQARLLIVGLAPAAHGGNRTGRVFTGDSSGDFLARALHASGFANQPTSERRDDGLELNDVYIAAAARCAPPDNKPTPAELARCLPYLEAEIAALTRLQVVVALGRIAFDTVVRVFSLRQAVGAARRSARPAFAHGAVHVLGGTRRTIVASYHPSRQNTNTGRLTPAMFGAVFAEARHRLTP